MTLENTLIIAGAVAFLVGLKFFIDVFVSPRFIRLDSAYPVVLEFIESSPELKNILGSGFTFRVLPNPFSGKQVRRFNFYMTGETSNGTMRCIAKTLNPNDYEVKWFLLSAVIILDNGEKFELVLDGKTVEKQTQC